MLASFGSELAAMNKSREWIVEVLWEAAVIRCEGKSQAELGDRHWKDDYTSAVTICYRRDLMSGL